MSLKVGEDVLEEIRQKCDIVNIISEYIQLRHTGKNYQGLCPFHHEKTPSFSVNREKQLFHCFGCKAGGNVFNFIMLMEKTDFLGAVELLAAKAGVKLNSEKKSEKDVFYEANLWANRYYCSLLLKSRSGHIARSYLAKRGISSKTAEAFRLGYALSGWDRLLKALLQKGVKAKTLEDVGLIIPKKNGGYYDRFRNRLIFPILDRYGKVIAFGGRVMDDSLPKYLNSPETVVFSKSRSLYGLYTALKKMREKRQVLMVEGYFDVISLYQAGVENVVASLGTALTTEHAKILSALVDEVIIAYDGDAAGEHAAVRGMEILAKAGLTVKILSWPSGYDPDSYVQEHGKEAVEDLLTEALPWLEYSFNHLLTGYEAFDLVKKKNAFAECLILLKKIPNVIERDEYIRLAAQKLGLAEKELRHELWLSERNSKVQNKEEKIRNTNHDCKNISSVVKAERTLLLLLMKNKALIPWFKANLTEEDFLSDIYKRIFLFIRELINDNVVDIEWAENLNHIDDEQLKTTILSLLLEELPDNNRLPEKMAADCFYVLKKERLKLLLEKKQDEIKSAEKRGESIRLLLTDYQKLLQQKKDLDRKGG